MKMDYVHVARGQLFIDFPPSFHGQEGLDLVVSGLGEKRVYNSIGATKPGHAGGDTTIGTPIGTPIIATAC